MSSIGSGPGPVSSSTTDHTTADATPAAPALANPTFAHSAKLEQIAEGHGSLSKGNTGAAVKIVQNALINLGLLPAHPAADGSFGSKTQAAVMAVQKSANLR